MKKILPVMLIATMVTSVLAGCVNDKSVPSKVDNTQIANLDFNFNVDPETLALEVESNGIAEKRTYR